MSYNSVGIYPTAVETIESDDIQSKTSLANLIRSARGKL
tara:strand:- start:36 stop:152 length:117 start_codon:yes stop_codon:yes gene_type:complete